MVLDAEIWASERDQWIKNHEESELEFFNAIGKSSN